MDEQIPLPARVAELAAIAAARETDKQYWCRQFTRLLLSRCMRVPAIPGSEVALCHLSWRHAAADTDIAVETAGLIARLRPILLAGHRVCVDLSEREAAKGKLRLADFETTLARGIGHLLRDSNQLSFSVCAEQPELDAVLRLRHSKQLSCPRIVVRFARGDTFRRLPYWPMLVAASHADRRVMPVPAMSSRQLSGLHALEQGQCVMPVSLFEVPADTSWLVLEIDALRMGPPRFLRAKLADCLRFADNLIDSVKCHSADLRLDAILNRRVAIHITGIGDLLQHLRRDPARAETFTALNRWLMFVRHCLIHESVRLARQRGPFPELGVEELVNTLSPYYGARNARRLISNRGLRHRHLLALSPFSVFPAHAGTAEFENWLKLIPAIACADTLCMYGADPRDRLSRQGWANLLQMTGALSVNAPIAAQSYTIYS